MIFFTAMGITKVEVFTESVPTAVTLMVTRKVGSTETVDQVAMHFETGEMAAKFREALLKEFPGYNSGTPAPV